MKDFFSEQFKKYWLYSTIVLFLIGIFFGPAGEKQSSAAMAIGALIGAGLGSAILGFIIAAIINVFTDKKIQGINPLEKDSTETYKPIRKIAHDKTAKLRQAKYDLTFFKDKKNLLIKEGKSKGAIKLVQSNIDALELQIKKLQKAKAKKPLVQEKEIKKSPETERAIKLYEEFLSETITLDNAENREQLKDEFKNWLKEKNK